jgi:hypothetical protein
VFAFTNILCKALNQSLVYKYCNERASSVTHFFGSPHKNKRERGKRENTTNIKKILDEHKKNISIRRIWQNT